MKHQEQRQEQPQEERPGRLQLKIETQKPTTEIHVLVTEAGMRGVQHRFQARDGELTAELAGGRYLLQVVAPGHRPAKIRVQLRPDETVEHSLRLESADGPALPAFEERLKAYGLSARQAVDELTLEGREHRVARSHEDEPGMVRLKARSLEQVRRFIGAPLGVYQDEEPRGEPVEMDEGILARLRKQEVRPEDRPVLDRVMAEYLYGNEKANAKLIGQLKPHLEKWLVGDFWFGLFRTLTIPAGATYEFGPGTLVLDRLRIHKTGKLVARGECKFDIAQWEEFT